MYYSQKYEKELFLPYFKLKKVKTKTHLRQKNDAEKYETRF